MMITETSTGSTRSAGRLFSVRPAVLLLLLFVLFAGLEVFYWNIVPGGATHAHYFFSHSSFSEADVGPGPPLANWDPLKPLSGNGMHFDRSGTITGTIMMTAVDGNGISVTLAAAQRQSAIDNFAAGLAKWKTDSVVMVCGVPVIIAPHFNIVFIDSVAQYQAGSNLVYIVVGNADLNTVFKAQPQPSPVLPKPSPRSSPATSPAPTPTAPPTPSPTPSPTPGNAMLGAYYYAQTNPDVLWSTKFETMRGTGELQAFAIVMTDPEALVAALPANGLALWQQTAAHEFGHAMGLWDTYAKASTQTYEEPPGGLMNYIDPSHDRVTPAYISEVMTRVFECRVNIKVVNEKTAAIGSTPWDYRAKVTGVEENVLTSEWAYFDGLESAYNQNPGTTSIRDTRTYKMNDASSTSSLFNDIHYGSLAGSGNTAYWAWEKDTLSSSSSDKTFSVSRGNCAEPVGNDASPLGLLVLGSDGQKLSLSSLPLTMLLSLNAKDPDPRHPPDCSLSVWWMAGPLKTTSTTTGSTWTGQADLFQSNQPSFAGPKQAVGTITFTLTMRLAPKSGPIAKVDRAVMR